MYGTTLLKARKQKASLGVRDSTFSYPLALAGGYIYVPFKSLQFNVYPHTFVRIVFYKTKSKRHLLSVKVLISYHKLNKVACPIRTKVWG